MSVFKKKDDTGAELAQMNSSNIIAKGTEISGDIETHGNIRIDGRIIGNIRSRSKIALGAGSFVKGNVVSQNAEVQGEVEGNVNVEDTLVLKASAVVKGDIRAKHMITESGAKFMGSCHIGEASKQLNLNEGKNKKAAASA